VSPSLSPELNPLPAFEANGFPLSPGVRLLEASAGTGKTFALAHLVLRLVGQAQEPLRLEQLLVVTFTEAAAAELRDRIAERLQRALALVELGPEAWAHHPDLAKDQPLAEWLQQTRGQSRLRAQLLLALDDLDRADITTIHGFCRRTLQRQALEAGLGPAVDLQTDASDQLLQISHDYWQQQVLGLPADQLAGLLACGLGPEQLARILGRLDGDPALELDPLPPGWDVDHPFSAQLERHWQQLWQAFITLWASGGEALERAFCAACPELKAIGAKTAPYAAKPRSNRVAQIDHWIASLPAAPSHRQVLELSNSASSARKPELLLRDYFHPGVFCRITAPLQGDGPPAPLPQAALLAAIAALVDGPAELLLLHFAHWGRHELALRRGRSGRIGFGELLQALDPGSAPSPLLQAVGQRYRVALIDEFQDTDPIQWRILEAAFTGTPQQHLLVMVGDPKQAIYRFRGGELATYRLARSRAEAVVSLQQNRRSSQSLVDALNALMQPTGLRRSQLPVPPVQACGAKGELLLPQGESPLQLLPLQSDGLASQVASLCLQLLERGLELRQGGVERPLQPQDLCLLVGRHSQAETLRQALELRGLPSRLVSRGDVFASEGATGLQRLLDALADPGQSQRQRLLAASPLLGWPAAEIATAEAERWDVLADQLSRLAAGLGRLGLVGVLGQLLQEKGLAQLSLRGRALADLQQAAELVQEQMHRQGLGPAAAADWLRRLRLDPDRQLPEAHQPRSDAAESAIAVVTVHRSKGLEYPVVICPYLWRGPRAARGGGEARGRRGGPPGSGAPRLDLHLNPHWGVGREAALQHGQAEQQEAERLAYVACTRAQHLLVLGWQPPAGQPHNPLADWLLEPSGALRELPLQPLDPASLPAEQRRWQPPPPSGELTTGPRPLHRLDTSWGRSSYSAWAHSARPLSPQASDEGRDIDDSPQAASADTPAAATWPQQGPLAGFPRGAGAGDALHRVLEQIDYQQPADAPSSVAVVARELERAGIDASQQEPLLLGLEQLRHTPLGGPLQTFCLADLPLQQRLSEMNFDLPIAQDPAGSLIRSSGLAEVFARHPGGLFGAAYAAQLRQLEVASRGFLTGSIDLVFRCQGRWWVADWKSNWLGEGSQCGPHHYSRAAMARLMASNHYPLQAHLYLVALHRYLRWRLPGYSPEQHLGGYAYVFLRGVPGPCQAEDVPGMLVEQPPLQRLLALDALLREGEP
jgi:exodeoxyribonuclease V beta subunit